MAFHEASTTLTQAFPSTRDVETGGGIWALLFERPKHDGTYAVFYDADQGGGFAIQRHTSTEAFWDCQHGCPAVHVETHAALTDGEVLDALTTMCEGEPCDACGDVI